MKYLILLVALAGCATVEPKDPDIAKKIIINVQPEVELVDFEPIRYGQKGDRVKIAQRLLLEKGYGDFSPTGYYGSRTHEAVVNFNFEHGIGEDDIGAITWSELQQ